jgi:hypothetical protein
MPHAAAIIVILPISPLRIVEGDSFHDSAKAVKTKMFFILLLRYDYVTLIYMAWRRSVLRAMDIQKI